MLSNTTTKHLEVTMSNNKQSSIDFLIKQKAKWGLLINDDLRQAKAMHKKETIDFALLCMMPNMEPDKSTIEVVSDIYDEVFNK